MLYNNTDDLMEKKSKYLKQPTHSLSNVFTQFV